MTGTEPLLRLDHLAVAAETLAEGIAWVEARFRCPVSKGGAHAAMGTHNALVSLGPDLYLEVIAIDPDAPAQGHPRWFGLDRFSGLPRVQAWILHTDDIAAAPACAGQPMALARGDLRWQMAVPASGLLPYDGMHPAVMSWEGVAHPAGRLPDRGIRLETLAVTHPGAEALQAELSGFADPRVRFAQGPVGLSAVFSTSEGVARL